MCPTEHFFVLSHKEDGMADSMFHQPVMGRRAFVGGTLAASSMAFLAACGKKSHGARSKGTANEGATTHNGLVEHRISHAILLMR